MIKHAFCNILHYSVLIVVNLYSVICFIFCYSGWGYGIVDTKIPRFSNHKVTAKNVLLFSCVYFLTFIYNVIIIIIVLIIEKRSYYCFDLKNLKQNIADITHDVNSFINPINLMYRNKDGKVTNKKILQICRNSSITLFCFSIGTILVFVITYSI